MWRSSQMDRQTKQNNFKYILLLYIAAVTTTNVNYKLLLQLTSKFTS